jgi:acetylornithine deacetylase
MLRCLTELVNIPSVTGSPEESRAQHWFADRLKENNFETDLWQIDLPAIKADPDFPGLEAPRSEAWGLVGSWGNSNGPTLVLNGHIDVVPPGDLSQWHEGDPYSGRIENGWLYGRGACDMKAGLVCNLFAVKAIQAAGIRLKGKVLLESVVGEEDGGLGTFSTLRQGYRGDAAIITEPTELQIIPACAGALTFRLRLKGLSAHASTRREGVSVIEKFWLIWEALEALEARRNRPGHPLMSRFDLPYPLSIGTLQAGNWPSSVPDELVAEGRLGVALGEAPEVARGELEAVVADVCRADSWLREHPVEVDWFGGQFASGQIPVEHPLIGLVSRTHEQLHHEQLTVHGAPYGSDLRLMTNIGQVPTLHYGPGSVKKAHAPNEAVPIAEMVTVTQTLAATILQFCGYE